MKFPHVFVAGTFDGLHKGHRFLLSKAFFLGSHVTIGLTSDVFTKQLKRSVASSFVERKKVLESWLRSKKKRADIVAIDDPFEPAASFPQSAALLVTADNKKRGEEINILRKKRNLPPLTLIEIPLVEGEDRRPISSTRVRNGEIDREGRLIMPDSLRPELQQPLGPVLVGEHIASSLKIRKGENIIAVGDVATKTLLDAGITPHLMIVDNKVERKPYDGLKKYQRLFVHSKHVKSGPGYISREAIELIKENKKMVLVVDGEEDLLTLPAVAFAPIGAVVYYGQPPMQAWGCGPVVNGLVEVLVTPETQKHAIAVLGQFIQ